jgi:hypothetical protein
MMPTENQAGDFPQGLVKTAHRGLRLIVIVETPDNQPLPNS